MNPELLTQLRAAQSTLEPQYHVLHTATSVLKRAIVLAGDETLDAIAQNKSIAQRSIDVPAFVAELYQAWQELLAKRQKAPAGKRINLVEIYS